MQQNTSPTTAVRERRDGTNIVKKDAINRHAEAPRLVITGNFGDHSRYPRRSEEDERRNADLRAAATAAAKEAEDALPILAKHVDRSDDDHPWLGVTRDIMTGRHYRVLVWSGFPKSKNEPFELMECFLTPFGGRVALQAKLNAAYDNLPLLPCALPCSPIVGLYTRAPQPATVRSSESIKTLLLLQAVLRTDDGTLLPKAQHVAIQNNFRTEVASLFEKAAEEVQATVKQHRSVFVTDDVHVPRCPLDMADHNVSALGIALQEDNRRRTLQYVELLEAEVMAASGLIIEGRPKYIPPPQGADTNSYRYAEYHTADDKYSTSSLNKEPRKVIETFNSSLAERCCLLLAQKINISKQQNFDADVEKVTAQQQEPIESQDRVRIERTNVYLQTLLANLNAVCKAAYAKTITNEQCYCMAIIIGFQLQAMVLFTVDSHPSSPSITPAHSSAPIDQPQGMDVVD